MAFNNSPWDRHHMAMAFIDVEHYQIHEGRGFYLTHEVAALADGGDSNLLFAVPANSYPHIRSFLVDANDAPMDVRLFEGTTVSSNGTEVSSFNLNRNSTVTPEMLVYHTPTITDDGTQIDYNLIHDTGGGEESFGGGNNDLPSEWILKPSTNYLMRVTNNAGAIAKIMFQIFWYEIKAST